MDTAGWGTRLVWRGVNRLPGRWPDIERRAFALGFQTMAPSLMALFSWGLVTGVAMSQSTLTVPQALGMTLLVYAGSAQLAVLPLLAAGTPLWAILLTAAMVNLRFVIYSAALQPHFAHLPLVRRLVLGTLNGDLGFVLFMRQGYPAGPVAGKEGFYYGITVTNWMVWQVSSILGILLASLVPTSWGLGFAGTLALIPVLIQTIVNRSTALAVVVAAVVGLLTFSLPYRLCLVIGVAAAIVAGMACDEMVERSNLRAIRARTRRGDEHNPPGTGQ